MDADRAQRLESTSATVLAVLAEMGLNPTSESVLPGAGDGFDSFMRSFCLREGCIPYPPDAVANMTVARFCELHVADSYPPPPTEPLVDTHYESNDEPPPRADVGAAQTFPICFVLGSGRSGTTLFRTMLNAHPAVWAPGELHLALFDDMAERAAALIPPVRYGLVTEVAARLGETKEAFSTRLAGWEQDARPVAAVYALLHDADPHTLIVDKTPTYSGWRRDLARIGREFPNATFVHLVRNPHDVIRSHVRMQLHKAGAGRFAPGLSPYQMAEIGWYRHNANIEAFLAGVPDDRQRLIRYEDLVADPPTELRTVCGLLGLSYDEAMADPYAGRDGRVALGAGDVRVNMADTVENREPGEAFYPLGARAEALAGRYGY